MIELVVLVLIASSAAAALVKPGCSSSCGNVSIPYPFGIGENCFLDRWYAINCSSNKPFLRGISLQVLSISVEKSSMIVSHPTGNGLAWRGVDLSGSPFFFSATENVLSGIGCDSLAFIRNSVRHIVAGCYSTCDGTNVTKGCFGNKCCKTMIPASLQMFETTSILSDFYYSPTPIPHRAIFVQEKWLTQQRLWNQYNLSDLVGNFTSVPVVLGWGILSYHQSNYHNSICQKVTITDLVVHQCNCTSGYQGNAYLPHGCQDIDECKYENTCPRGELCRNKIGGHQCYTNPKSAIITGTVVGVICLLLLMSGGWQGHILLKKRKNRKLKERYFKRIGLLLRQKLTSFDGNVDSKVFNLKELDKATDHFNENRILGQGGQGTVYKGMLTDGRIVAIKKSRAIDDAKIEEFINEVAILSQISHRNVVKLLGCCLVSEVPLLVYEYVPNGTLSQYLHNQSDEFLLTWEMRLRIAAEVAGALFYLHSSASLPVYHRDIKSSNILLDDKYRAKIADFGTSKSLSTDQTHVTTKVMGTFGYLDPEYFQSSQFTDKSDVYSFGVVLVELLTGQKPISLTRSEDSCNLVAHFIILMEENKLLENLDPEVMKGDKENVVSTAELAKRCLNSVGKNRPTMREVASILEGIRTSQSQKNRVPTTSFAQVD